MSITSHPTYVPFCARLTVYSPGIYRSDRRFERIFKYNEKTPCRSQTRVL